MREIQENTTGRPLGTLWNWIWPLLFIGTLTVLSVLNDRHTSAIEHQTTAAHATQPSPAAATGTRAAQ
jgi:ABC-type polysaccharide/polyol phosphate export permease